MYNNLCSRCGKARVFARSWEEKIGNSVVITTENVCPDPECQKMVEKENKKKIEKMKSNQLKRKNNLRNRRKVKSNKK